MRALLYQVNTAELEQAIQESFYTGVPIVIDIYAVWCGPCQELAPQLEEAAAHFGDRCRFLKVDSDEEPDVASTLNVNGLPTVLFIKDLRVVARAEGMLMADVRGATAMRDRAARPRRAMPGTDARRLPPPARRS